MSGSHRKQIRQFDGEGDARELTFSCRQRKAYVSKPYVVQWFFKALQKARDELPIHVWAYVVMPEHIHLLVWPIERQFKISRLLATIKLSVSKKAANHLRRNNPKKLEGTEFQFWQSGPEYDRNLENEATVWAAIDYIHRNPVRRGLCDRAIEWPWSSFAEHAGQSGPVKIDRESLPPDPRR